MQLSERTYFEDKVKMDAQWVIIFILVSSIGTLAIAITVMLNEEIRKWTEIALVTGTILLSDTCVVILFRKMNLELATTKQGLHYKMNPFGKLTLLNWKEVRSIRTHKMKHAGYGKQHKWKYGIAIVMNHKPGIEFELQNGRKLFLSMNEADDFKRSIRKLELPILIE